MEGTGEADFRVCFIARCPGELLLECGPRCLDRAQPIGRLASTCRSLASGLRSGPGGLRVGAVVISTVDALQVALASASPEDLLSLTVDLASRGDKRSCRPEVERVLQELGDYLVCTTSLQALRVRLASFDLSMERLRLGPQSWEALVRGLNGVANCGRLRTLELSYITIKASQATQSVRSGGRVLRRAATSPTRSSVGASQAASILRGSPGVAVTAAAAAKSASTFLDALGQMDELEELRLTHDEIFGSTAQLLPPVLTSLTKLRQVDLTRNHIPKQVMEEMRGALPRRVQLAGDDQQTFFFY
mmetsp:Transcript_90901/g.261975  ORF Transcript_90901/g.261975 Transcript_90901/m.261975 type:complete len:304 (-) Transcript_90901:217-1128(-)